ncbi:ABC transporter substrate-binding protein [Carnobacterium gallinarum]|uniref:ABC transporter substrate-binding protein n=1 Tax=Carnobacterium gallinarum TaxID=2749 RepID=UPI000550C473|nr:ABC transporter substrate-binding protein [Carnobacterium gallinarum]
MKKIIGSVFAVIVLIFLTACGGNETQQETKDTTASNYPVTIGNYSKAEGATEWQKKEQTFKKMPERVLVNTRPAAELMLRLGLDKQIAGVGATFGIADELVAKQFDQLNHLGDSYISKEVALSVDPDMIYGRGSLFENEEWGNGTVDSINEMGIPTYVVETSIPGATFNSVYKDIENLGQIFNVPDEAEKFTKELKERQAKLNKKVADIKKEQTFAYLHMNEPTEVLVYSAYGESFFNDAFATIKLNNAFKDIKGDVSIETLIETDPDVLIVPDWSTYKDGVKKEDMIRAILENKKLASMKAIKNKQVYAVDYNYMFGYGYQSLTGMELLATELYGK